MKSNTIFTWIFQKAVTTSCFISCWKFSKRKLNSRTTIIFFLHIFFLLMNPLFEEAFMIICSFFFSRISTRCVIQRPNMKKEVPVFAVTILFLELCPSLKSVSGIVYLFFIPSVDFRRRSIRVLKFSFVMIVMKPSKNFPFFLNSYF